VTQKRKVLLATMAASGIAGVALLTLLFQSQTDAGDPVRAKDNIEDLREALKLLLDTQQNLTTLILGAFGATAFLVTLQTERRARVGGTSLALLFAGVVMLLAALILVLVGREILLSQVGRNAVDLSVRGLIVGRWIAYLCLVLAALLVGAYAIDVALVPPRRDP
jgi:hypothetical protein